MSDQANSQRVRSEFENLYGKGNPILDDLCDEILPPYKDFSVVFESIYLERGERHTIDMQIPFELIVNPQIFLNFDENEIRGFLERSGLEVGEIEQDNAFIKTGFRFSFVTPNSTTIKFFTTSYFGNPCLELRQQTQPPYAALIRFADKGDGTIVEICVGEIGHGGTMYYECYTLKDLLKTKNVTLPPDGQAWDDDSKRGRRPLNAARIFQ